MTMFYNNLSYICSKAWRPQSTPGHEIVSKWIFIRQLQKEMALIFFNFPFQIPGSLVSMRAYDINATQRQAKQRQATQRQATQRQAHTHPIFSFGSSYL